MPDKKPQWAFRTMSSDKEYIVAWDQPVYISHDRDMDVVFRTTEQFVKMLDYADNPENEYVRANSLWNGEERLFVSTDELTDNEFGPRYFDYYIPRGALLSLRKLPEGWKPDADDDIH